MIRIDLSKIESFYTREVELKPKQHVKFYGVLFLSTLTIFVLLGIRPTLISYARDSVYRSELKSLRSTMRDKLEDLKLAEKDLKKIDSTVETLYNKVPETGDTQNFLREFVVTASKSGFIVDKLKMRKTDERSISLSIKLNGSIGNIPKLSLGVENLNRITTIDEIKFSPSKGDKSINLFVTTYYLQKDKKGVKNSL